MEPVRERRELGVDGRLDAAAPPARPAEAESSGGFAVRMQGATLFDLIQFECMKRARRIVRLRDGMRSGYLYFRDGNVVHAIDGVLNGETAFRSLLRWQRGSFETCEGAWPAVESITVPSQTLLLGMAQEQDERARDATPNVLSFPGKDLTDVNELKDSLEPPSATHEKTPGKGAATMTAPLAPASTAALAPPTLLRISADGVTVVRGAPAEAQQLAEVAAYAAQMADVVGDLLLGSGFDLLEVALASGACAVSRHPSGDLFAAKGGAATDPAVVRTAVERAVELK